jgi:hypothetical protein
MLILFLLHVSAVTYSHPQGANIHQYTQHAVCPCMASRTLTVFIVVNTKVLSAQVLSLYACLMMVHIQVVVCLTQIHDPIAPCKWNPI